MEKTTVLNKIFNFIMPPTCLICGESMTFESNFNKKVFIHKKCQKDFILLNSSTCYKCGKKVEDKKQVCSDCANTTHFFDKNVSLFEYNEHIKKSIYRFKYLNKKEYAKYYANIIYYKYLDWIKSLNVDAIMAVPLSPEKEALRGYNQAHLIAKHLSDLTKIKVDNKILSRKNNTKPMKELSKKERKENVKDVFFAKENNYKNILLIDDIYTTGATIDEIAKVLKEKGVKKVHSITLCVGEGF